MYLLTVSNALIFVACLVTCCSIFSVSLSTVKKKRTVAPPCGQTNECEKNKRRMRKINVISVVRKKSGCACTGVLCWWWNLLNVLYAKNKVYFESSSIGWVRRLIGLNVVLVQTIFVLLNLWENTQVAGNIWWHFDVVFTIFTDKMFVSVRIWVHLIMQICQVFCHITLN